jgi:hypothetical protein
MSSDSTTSSNTSSIPNYLSSTEDAKKLLSKVYLNVIFNWPIISQNQEIMQVLNMETNLLCKTHKELYPSLRDSFIQTYILTQMITIWTILSFPLETVYNGGVEYLKTCVDKETEFTNNLNNNSSDQNQEFKESNDRNLLLMIKTLKEFDVD